MPTGEHKGPYGPRVSVELKEDIAKFVEAVDVAERPLLTEYERNYIFDIEKSINERNPDWYLIKSSSIDFVINYFSTPEGEDSLAKLYQEYAGNFVSTTDSAQETLSILMVLADDNNNLELALRRLSIESHNYVSNVISSGQLGDDFELKHFAINLNPQAVFDSIKSISTVRGQIRDLRRGLANVEMSENCKQATSVVLDIYLKKTASLLGQLYPDYVDIFDAVQLLTDCDKKKELLDGLEGIDYLYKLSYQLLEESNNDISDRFAWTMDRWRNGVVYTPENTPLSSDLQEFAKSVEVAKSIINFEPANGRFTSEEVSHLDSLTLTSKDAHDLAVHILRSNGLYSESKDYNSSQWPIDSSAESPKVGVVIGPFQNLSYERGWIKIPENIHRKGFQQSPSGIFLVVAHEVEHAFDGVSSLNSNGLRLNQITSRGSTLIREGVGKSIEGIVSEALTGRSISSSLTYYRAMEVWLSTGSEIRAIKAFAEQAALEAGYQEPTPAQLANAENRVQRLISKHGINSQALVYLEQGLMAKSLQDTSPSARSTISANSGIDVHSQVGLAPYGLLETIRYVPEKSIVDCVEEFIRKNYIK